MTRKLKITPPLVAMREARAVMLTMHPGGSASVPLAEGCFSRPESIRYIGIAARDTLGAGRYRVDSRSEPGTAIITFLELSDVQR